MARLIHVNGPPGIGKSTLARRYVDEHPGVLNCDIDRLRPLVGGWQEDFHRTGRLIRPAALAMIASYLANGHDVVLPQMLVDPAEIERFAKVARDAGADFVECLLTEDLEVVLSRYHRRQQAGADDAWLQQVGAVIDQDGGEDGLRWLAHRIETVVRRRAETVAVCSHDGDVEATYRALLNALDESDAGAATTPPEREPLSCD